MDVSNQIKELEERAKQVTDRWGLTSASRSKRFCYVECQLLLSLLGSSAGPPARHIPKP